MLSVILSVKFHFIFNLFKGNILPDEHEDQQPATTIIADDQPTTSSGDTTAKITQKRRLTRTEKLIDFENKKLRTLTEILTKEEKPDEWQKFTDSLTDDLRYIKHPILKTQIKNGISNLISEFIHKQYEMNSNEVVNSE